MVFKGVPDPGSPDPVVRILSRIPGLVSETSLYDPQRQQLRRLSASTVAGGTWQMKMLYCPGVDESAACTSNNGNVLRQEGSVPGLSGAAVWSYAYDSLNRLWSAVETLGGTEKWHQTMKYDPYGNRSVVNDAGTLLTQELATPRVSVLGDPSPFDAKNRWTGADYDFAGQQKTSWGDGSAVGAAKYFYDAEGKMNRTEVRWTSTSSGAIDYGYDGEGRRVLKKVGGAVKTVFVYDAMGQLVAEYGESGAMPCTSCYLTADHLGSTRVIWGQDGVMKKLLDYAPFGEEVGANYRANDLRYPGGVYPRDGGMGVPVEFTGKERDGETGLDYFETRHFSSAEGRFTSPDSLIMKKEWFSDPQRWNHFAYVRNNPLRYIDPNGEDLTIVYSFGPDASNEQRKWFELNKDKIFAAIQQKFNDAGVKNVTFKDATSLSKDDLKKLTNSPIGSDKRTTGITGVVRLAATGQESSVFKGYAPPGTYGATHHGMANVFMDRGGKGGPACDAACGFANIAAHEIGHGLGFDDPGHNFMNIVGFAPTAPDEWFRDNVMKQGGNPYEKPLPFRADKNQRAIDEVNRAKPFPQ